MWSLVTNIYLEDVKKGLSDLLFKGREDIIDDLVIFTTEYTRIHKDQVQ